MCRRLHKTNYQTINLTENLGEGHRAPNRVRYILVFRRLFDESTFFGSNRICQKIKLIAKALKLIRFVEQKRGNVRIQSSIVTSRNNVHYRINCGQRQNANISKCFP